MFEIEHLKYAKQNYFSHFIDTVNYSFTSLKASVFFIIHGFIPCIFTKKGSDIIHQLDEIIIEKRSNIEKMLN
jgi:hypothetical protein